MIMKMNEIPKEKGLDHSLQLLKEGYTYLLERRKKLETDIFETKLLGEKVICLGGEEATKLFYDNRKFKRDKAAPNRALNTLFGQGGVQTLDGEAHAHRKKMFMSLMSEESLKVMRKIAKEQWELASAKWEKADRIVLYEEVQEILCQSACIWAGVPVREKEFLPLAKALTAMFEGPAKVGPKHREGKKARNEAEKWLKKLVVDVREGELKAPKNTALYQFSWHLDRDGKLLDEEIVAVEVLNILRPIVAIAIYINFVAHAIIEFPHVKENLQNNDEEYVDRFVQEVRRYYPFFPFAGARVKQDFEWKNYKFKKNTLTILDLYGTNHDRRLWKNPDEFNPARFEEESINEFNLIPQGGGNHMTGHRCPGEWITVDMMKIAADYLVNRLSYDIPNQDLSYSMVDIPSMPKDKVILKNVRRKI